MFGKRKATTGIGAAIASARSEIDGIRDHIAGLLDKRAAIASQAVDLAEMERRVDSLIAAKGLQVGVGLADPDRATFIDWQHKLSTLDPLALLISVAPALVRDAMLKPHLDSAGVSPAERFAQLAEIDAQIDAAEVAEEAAIRELERAAGSDFPRRETVRNPLVFIAPDREVGL